MVDSHARSADGMVDGTGKSVVVHFSSLEQLCKHIERFASVFKQTGKQFELADVWVVHKSAGANVTLKTEETESVSDVAEKCSVLPTVSISQSRRREKRKMSADTSKSKKVKISDTTALNSDVVFVSEVTSKRLHFNPLSVEVAQVMCQQLKVPSQRQARVITAVGELGVPCRNEKITPDGNCFFRAVSQAVCGTQNYHPKIRNAVVKQLENNATGYSSILRSEYSSMSQYISKSKMKSAGSWATEMEIQAAADSLGVSIYTYCNDRWLEYSCKSSPLSDQGIYLENCYGNHYETVVCVKRPQMQCYGYCKVDSSSGYNIRQQTRQRGGEVNVDSLSQVAKPNLLTQEPFSKDQITFKFNPLGRESAKILCRTQCLRSSRSS